MPAESKIEVQISYEFDASYPDNPFWAIGQIADRKIFCSGQSYESARDKLIKQLNRLKPLSEIPVPSPETITLQHE